MPVVRVGGRIESLEELRLELSLPLRHEGRGRHDQYATREAANGELLEDDPRLDRLAEAHLVGEDGAAAHLTQHAARDLDLMGKLLDRVRVEGDESLESRRESDSLCLTSKLDPRTGARRLDDTAGELRERALVDCPQLAFFSNAHSLLHLMHGTAGFEQDCRTVHPVTRPGNPALRASRLVRSDEGSPAEPARSRGRPAVAAGWPRALVVRRRAGQFLARMAGW